MQKSLLRSKIVALAEDGVHPDVIKKASESTGLHSRFNPSQVGFGILAVAKDIQHPAAGIDDDITSEITIKEGQ